MSNASESSVLFNLRELMDLERTRVQSEEEARRAAEAEALARRRADAERREAAREAAERAAREAAEAAERAARDEEERRAMARREHELRLAAELEAKVRAEEVARKFEHERTLLEIDARSRRRVSPWLLAGLAALLIGSGVGVYFGVVVPAEAERDRLAARMHDLQARTADIDRVIAQGEANAAEIARLRAERDRIATELAARAVESGQAPTPTHPAVPPRPPRPPRTDPPRETTQSLRDCRGPLGCLRHP